MSPLSREGASAFRQAREHHRNGRLEDAARLLESVLQSEPGFERAWYVLGVIEGERGRYQEAAARFEHAVTLAPERTDSRQFLARSYVRLGRFDDAVREYEQILQLDPRQADALVELGTIQYALGDLEGATARFRMAIETDANCADAHYRLGVALRAAHAPGEAVAALRNACALQPGRDKFLVGLGNALKDCGALDEAAGALRSAAEAAPRSAPAWAALGATLALAGDSREAIAALERAIAIDPAYLGALGRLIREKEQICDWTGLGDLVGRARHLLQSNSGTISPFVWLSATESASEQRDAAEVWARGVCAGVQHARLAPRNATLRGRIRIGYLSADFHEHATAYLLAEVIELHNRGAFKIFAYSWGPDDRGSMRHRLKSAFDVFRDVSRISDLAVAQLIRNDEIDILVDLKGYTHQARTGISAMRPAPVIVSYLGFPGTLGTGIADYLIGDPSVTPLDCAEHYAEQLVVLPACYQPHDRKRPRAPRPRRADIGLPEEALVLCNFNQIYKVTPRMFDIWCEALRAFPDAVLWLLESRPIATENLRREAAARGVDPRRIAAAQRLPQREHLQRLACADLALDTYPFSSHTTGSDALWCGVPLVTLAGQTFASRVGASLLHAVGLEELVTRSYAGYRDLILALVSHRDRLRSLRDRLEAARGSAPLFDTPGLTRALETAYRRMWERAIAREPPRHIVVSSLGG